MRDTKQSSTRHPHWRITFAIGLTLVLATSVAAGPKLTDEQRTKLEAGEILTRVKDVEPHSATLAHAVGIVDAPPAAVWKHIDACGDYSKFLPRVAESEEMSRKGEDVVCRTVVSFPFPIGDVPSEMACRHRVLGEDRFQRQWKGIKGPYHVNEGSWNLFPWGEDKKRTLVVYSIKVAPEVQIPQALRRKVQEMTLPNVIEAVRKRVTETAE